MRWIDALPWPLLLIAALTLGLAPFVPAPHLWEKLQLLAAGELHRALDVFDLLLHAAPWVLLALKLLRRMRRPGDAAPSAGSGGALERRRRPALDPPRRTCPKVIAMHNR